jgi:hypothetical protein
VCVCVCVCNRWINRNVIKEGIFWNIAHLFLLRSMWTLACGVENYEIC